MYRCMPGLGFKTMRKRETYLQDQLEVLCTVLDVRSVDSTDRKRLDCISRSRNQMHLRSLVETHHIHSDPIEKIWFHSSSLDVSVPVFVGVRCVCWCGGVFFKLKKKKKKRTRAKPSGATCVM